MSLALVKTHLSGALAKLGTARDAKSAPPPSTDNRFAIAWEYFVADFLCSVATKRKELAKKAADEVGIISKPEAGDTKSVFRADGLQIIAVTKSASQTIDRTKLMSALMKRLGEKEATQIIAEATKTNSPATSYSFVGEE